MEVLCKGFPAVFTSYLNYCRALRFEDRPDYTYLRRLFKDVFHHENFVNDGRFDWSQPSSAKAGELAGLESKTNAAGEESGAVGDKDKDKDMVEKDKAAEVPKDAAGNKSSKQQAQADKGATVLLCKVWLWGSRCAGVPLDTSVQGPPLNLGEGAALDT